MRRPANLNEYVIRVNTRKGSDVRRFCEVHVKNGSNVYIFQPEKGKSVKVSYHKSGQQHVKRGDSAPIIQPIHLDSTAVIGTQETPWSKSLENFENLLPYRNEPADDVFEIDIAALHCVDTLLIGEIAIGHSFDPGGWTGHGVEQVTITQKAFLVPHSPNGLQVCVRIVRLQHAG